jgi:hypothetical protein
LAISGLDLVALLRTFVLANLRDNDIGSLPTSTATTTTPASDNTPLRPTNPPDRGEPMAQPSRIGDKRDEHATDDRPN